jgi:hypothetical protein
MLDINPIDVLKQRELSTLPPHFTKVKIADNDLFDNKVKNWIKAKLKGRYCIVKSPAIDSSGNLKSSTFAAFEDQKELTYFMLACPHLRRN